MKCPNCDYPKTQVYDTHQDRFRKMQGQYWRRRACVKCDHRWQTVEIFVAHVKPHVRMKSKRGKAAIA